MPIVSCPGFTSVSFDFAHEDAAAFVVVVVLDPPPHPAAAVAVVVTTAASATRRSWRRAPITAASLSAPAAKTGFSFFAISA